MAAPQGFGYGAGAGLTSVVQEGPDRYRATFANGNVIPLYGQTGKKLYEQQQAAVALSQPRDQPTAPEQVAPAPAPPKPGERVGSTVVAPPQGGQEEPEAAQEAAPQQAGPVSLGQNLDTVDPATGKKVVGEAFKMPDGTVRVYEAPRAGSPGGLTSLGKQTMAQYAEAQALAAEHGAKAAEYQQVGIDLAVQDAEARQAYIEEQKIQTQLEMQKQADEEAELQQKVANLESSYQKASQEFASARVDPQRLTKGGKGWLYGLAAALGAFGAGLARTPNFAMNFISERISDDIRAQEAEINVKGRNADNQLAMLTRSLGDLKLAKTAFRQLKLEEASLEGQRVANQFKGQAVANNARMVAEQSAAESIKAGEQRSREFVEHVMKDKLYYRQGSAGSPGRFLLTGTNELQGRKNLEADPASTDRELARAQARAELHPVESGRTEKISAFAAGIDSAIKITQELEKRGVTGDVYDDPQSGPLDRIGNLEENADLRRETIRLASGYQAARGKSDKDAELAEKDAIGSGSGRDRYKSAQAAVETFAKKAREEIVTLPPNKQQELLAGMSAEARAAILGEKKK